MKISVEIVKMPPIMTRTQSQSKTPEETEEVSKFVQVAMNNLFSDKEFLQTLATNVSKIVVRSLQPLLDKQSEKIQELKNKVVHLEKQGERIDKRVETMERNNLRNCVRIWGIEESESEDIQSVVINLINSVLKIKCSNSDIVCLYRLGLDKKSAKKDDNIKPRPVVLRFVNYERKLTVLKAVKNLKGTGISIKEELTPTGAGIYKAALQKYGPKNVWIFGGRVWKREGDSRLVIGDIDV